jgi:hypothetical protein
MNITKVLFHPNESPASVASRIVYAFSIGDILKIQDRFFQVTGIKSIIAILPPKGSNYTLVCPLEPKDLHPAKKKVKCPSALEPQVPTTPEAIKLPKPGQRWEPKDSRRRGSFLVMKVDSEYFYSADDRKVALTKLSRYRKV